MLKCTYENFSLDENNWIHGQSCACKYTWFGYNLQAELHCAVCLYSLIEETVVRVKLKVHKSFH